MINNGREVRGCRRGGEREGVGEGERQYFHADFLYLQHLSVQQSGCQSVCLFICCQSCLRYTCVNISLNDYFLSSFCGSLCVCVSTLVCMCDCSISVSIRRTSVSLPICCVINQPIQLSMMPVLPWSPYYRQSQETEMSFIFACL